MWVVRALVRALRLAGYFAGASVELAFRRPSTRRARAEWLHRFAGRAVRGLGVEISLEGEFPEGAAVLSNHLSYLDIVVFAAVHPCVFVAKAEIGGWPVVGWMTTMSGTVYVERGHGGSAKRARGQMKAAAEEGLPVVFFPEGTTSDGSGVLRFHSGLLAQAMLEGLPVVAASLRYAVGAENPPDVTVQEDVCWGEKALLPHLFRLLGMKELRAEMRVGDGPIAFSQVALANRKVAAVEARAAVMELLEAGRDFEGFEAVRAGS